MDKTELFSTTMYKINSREFISPSN